MAGYASPHQAQQLLPKPEYSPQPSAASSPDLSGPEKSPTFAGPPADPEVYERKLARDARRKRRIRGLKLVSRLLTLALSLYGVVSQGLTLHKYLSTRDIIRNGRNAWAGGTFLWPTILLLITSALTVIVAVITLISYFRPQGVRSANAVSTFGGIPATVAEHCAHVAVWIGTAVAYRVGRTGSDLWGWTCDPRAQRIQRIFPEVDFNYFCDVQSGSWAVSLAQAALVIVTFAVWGYAWHRERRKKAMRKTWQIEPTREA